MTIELFRFTALELADLRNRQSNKHHVYEYLPEYVLIDTPKRTMIKRTREYLDHLDPYNEFTMLDILNVDNPMGYEIDNVGMDEVFEEIDFSFLKKMDYNLIRYEDLMTLHRPVHLVFDFTYTPDGDDIKVKVDGYLDFENWIGGRVQIV